MSLKTRDFDRLTNKFGFETRNSGDKLAWMVYEGRRVVWTKRSQGRGDLPCQDLIRQQMKLNKSEFQQGLDCTLTREGYISLLKDKGIIRTHHQEE
jgi:hypothetical protein